MVDADTDWVSKFSQVYYTLISRNYEVMIPRTSYHKINFDVTVWDVDHMFAHSIFRYYDNGTCQQPHG